MSTATFVYDDDCGFCTWAADEVATRTDLDVVGYSELDDETRERLPEDYERSSHLVTDDEVYSGGESFEQALLRSEAGDELRPAVSFLRQFDDYDRFRERAYRWVADHRGSLGTIVSKTPPAGKSNDGS